ncbi:MAG: penicillin binding protein PBP4B [Clostridia bacterium]|nr:penicillin binding protein PBP4B [Clostridia bacterium]
MAAVKADAVPQFGWQKTAAFPDWKGYTDDTLAMNSMVSFRFFHGQGAIWLGVPDTVERYSLYVNGVKYDTEGLTGGVWQVDISGDTVDGVNTLEISNVFPLGLNRAITVHIPYPSLLEDTDGTEGIRPEALEMISDIIESDIRHGFTSAQLAVIRNGRLVFSDAWGTVNAYHPDGSPKADSAPVTTGTLYDLASVTKMFSVNYAVQKLVTDGTLDIESRIADILGEGFAADTLDFAYADAEAPVDHETQLAWKRALTVRDMLRHQAGFPAGPHYNNPDYDMSLQAVGARDSNLCYAVTREETLAAIFRTPLLYKPGEKTVYSDVDYMLLTFVVEAVTGQRLDAYMDEVFFKPLGLTRTAFLPLAHGFKPDDCAATELNGNTRDGHVFFDGIRTGTLQGEVQDERAWYCMEGVSGHAGLFANAEDLAKLAGVMLTGGYGEHRFFSRNVIDLFTAPKAVGFGQWGLGWWREGDDQRVWYFGTQAAPDTVGHQGWTGTLAMTDPSRNLVIAYLTNKINSPVTDESNLNGFDGSCYTASTLGFVPQILSIGMDSGKDISGQLLDLAADMATESLRLIPEGADAQHPYVKNAESKIEVLRRYAGNDAAYHQLADQLTGMLPGR